MTTIGPAGQGGPRPVARETGGTALPSSSNTPLSSVDKEKIVASVAGLFLTIGSKAAGGPSPSQVNYVTQGILESPDKTAKVLKFHALYTQFQSQIQNSFGSALGGPTQTT